MVRSAAALKRLQKKLPSWASKGIALPQNGFCVEQASSEATAWYRSSTILKPTDGFFADVTGGFGVDVFYMAQGARKGIYLERDKAVFAAAKSNFEALQLSNVKMYNTDSMLFLERQFAEWCGGDEAKRLDVGFADPCRRSNAGEGRAFKLADYEPNVLHHLPLLLRLGKRVVLKTSPFLDISLAAEALRTAAASPLSITVHVVSVDGSCKEVVYDIQQGVGDPGLGAVHCVDIHGGRFCAALAGPDPLSPLLASVFESRYLFDLGGEGSLAQPPAVGGELRRGGYVYEPSASVMKAGGFKSIARDYGLHKLHINSHLYWHARVVEAFPGRSFRLLGQCRPERTKLRRLLTEVAPEWALSKGSQVAKAHVTARNYPADVAQIRRKCGIAEAGSGDAYIFATTLSVGSKKDKRVLLLCEKLGEGDATNPGFEST